MATIRVGSQNQLAPQMLESMHEFRREIFVGRLGWALPQIGGTERDQYDTADAVYLIACDEAERITACARLLPTTGSYMLPELFSELLGGAPAPRHASIWELSRFAADVRSGTGGRVLSFSETTLELLAHVFSIARQYDVERLVVVTSISIERLLLRAGFEVHRLSVPARVGDALSVALFIEVPKALQRDADAELH
jgi:N-acyl-L-homoserine lactone synthetase